MNKNINKVTTNSEGLGLYKNQKYIFWLVMGSCLMHIENDILKIKSQNMFTNTSSLVAN